jgi:hypothetical protein
MPRKYNHRGYQDEDRDRESPPPREDNRERAPRRGYGPREPKTVNMPSFHEVLKCARCGQLVTSAIAVDTACVKCGSDLHSCAQCTWFDTAGRFECGQPVPERVSPKQSANTCTFFEGRVTVERQTHSNVGRKTARQAFDDLFK